jgi:hypothetical protein
LPYFCLSYNARHGHPAPKTTISVPSVPLVAIFVRHSFQLPAQRRQLLQTLPVPEESALLPQR